MFHRPSLGLVTSSLLVAVVAACSSASTSAKGDGEQGPVAGSYGTPGGSDPGPYYPLELNDVTILAPLPSGASPVLVRGADLADDGAPFVPRALFDRLVRDSEDGSPNLSPVPYEQLQAVAVRFDLCDRRRPGVCPETEDARMRVVFQPVDAAIGTKDAALHAFFAIKNAEIGSAIASLRELARSAPAAQTGALRASPSLVSADSEGYRENLRAFILRYGGEGRLVRLTMMGATEDLQQRFRWTFRGMEKPSPDRPLSDIRIVDSTALSESVLLVGGGYEVSPEIQKPTGFTAAITQRAFETADASKQKELLAALVEVENPMAHSADTVACASCHVSTAVMHARTKNGSIDPLSLRGRYTSKYDLSVGGGSSAGTDDSLRALGYHLSRPMISQRVVNETAQVLTEIETRYPAP